MDTGEETSKERPWAAKETTPESEQQSPQARWEGDLGMGDT